MPPYYPRVPLDSSNLPPASRSDDSRRTLVNQPALPLLRRPPAEAPCTNAAGLSASGGRRLPYPRSPAPSERLAGQEARSCPTQIAPSRGDRGLWSAPPGADHKPTPLASPHRRLPRRSDDSPSLSPNPTPQARRLRGGFMPFETPRTRRHSRYSGVSPPASVPLAFPSRRPRGAGWQPALPVCIGACPERSERDSSTLYSSTLRSCRSGGAAADQRPSEPALSEVEGSIGAWPCRFPSQLFLLASLPPLTRASRHSATRAHPSQPLLTPSTPKIAQSPDRASPEKRPFRARFLAGPRFSPPSTVNLEHPEANPKSPRHANDPISACLLTKQSLACLPDFTSAPLQPPS